ncbi:MAG TPA: hypothetical protein PLR97_05670 [Bacilli bacterium]|nr:hypothetical protein [Bacilli bacterium]
MKVFTDPINRIPPLLESDINSKIIISVSISPTNIKYISYVRINKFNSTLTFRGCRSHQNQIYDWADSYNAGISVLDLINKEYKILTSDGFKVTYYIIESKKELKTFMRRNNIENGLLGIELFEVWNKLKENKNIKENSKKSHMI